MEINAFIEQVEQFTATLKAMSTERNELVSRIEELEAKVEDGGESSVDRSTVEDALDRIQTAQGEVSSITDALYDAESAISQASSAASAVEYALGDAESAVQEILDSLDS